MIPALLGFALGFVGSIPLAGPISVLVFKLGAARRLREGAATALGAALAEALYCLAALVAMAELRAVLPSLDLWLRGVGAVVFVGLGAWFTFGRHTLRSPEGQAVEIRSRWRAFATGAVICLLNPTLLITWSGVGAAAHALMGAPLEGGAAALFAAGAGVGIAAWFTTLLTLMDRLGARLRPEWLLATLRGLGVLLIALGVWAGSRLLSGSS